MTSTRLGRRRCTLQRQAQQVHADQCRLLLRWRTGVHRLVADHHAMLVGAHLGAPHPERPAEQRGMGVPRLRNGDVGAGELGTRRMVGARGESRRTALRCARGRCSCRTGRSRSAVLSGRATMVSHIRSGSLGTRCGYRRNHLASAFAETDGNAARSATLRAEDHVVTVMQESTRLAIWQPHRILAATRHL